MPWLLAAALATSAPHAGHLPLWLSILAGGVLLGRLWIWRQNARLPARWLLSLLALVGVAGIGWQFHTLFGRDAGVALLVLFMALKPMEMRTRRDAVVVVMLGFFLLLTHYFYSQNIPTGLWLLATTALLTATLIRVHGGAQSASDILRLAGLMLLQAVPIMLAAFLLFPRVAGPLWGLPRDANAGLTGLSDRMAPGSLNNLIQSGEIAFRVQFAGEPPAQSRLYWRGPVLEDFDGLTWSALPRPRPRTPSAQVIAADARIYRYVSTLEAHGRRWLLALDLPVSLPENATLTTTLEARSPEPVNARARFAFTSIVDYRVNVLEDANVVRSSLLLPPGFNPRSRQLAEAWHAEYASPRAIADAALRYFRQEAFYYTLQPPLLGRDGIDDFLFVSRRGFCEHYAAAFVFLMRAAGVPARVVTGYQGGEINPVDGYLTVRQSDAHAWAEIWIAGQGWLRVDPTAAVAPARIERGIDAALPVGETLPMMIRIDSDWLRNLRHRWEATNNAWNQWVLGYNPERQRYVLARLGVSEPDWRRMTTLLAVFCALALLVVTGWTLYQRRTTTPAQRAWQGFCRRLARLGVVRADWEGPLALAARVARERPELAGITAAAAGHFADLHYGEGSSERLQELRACTQVLKRIL
ncbi:MAG: DUF3488 and transglutaminase-like domain-containing protein [Propionivibrio sp.]